MQPKFEFTGETKTVMGHTLQRIRALRSFGNVNKGDLGGWLEKEENLSHERNSWVYDDAQVFDDAQVYGNARVYDGARVYDDARVYGDAWVYGGAWVSGGAWVFGDARVYGGARVYSGARVYGGAWVYGGARVYGGAQICDQRHIDVITHIGSRNGTTTFFRTADRKIWVNCGCFSGDIDQFAAAVKKTHGNNKHAQDYAAAIERAKAWIDLSEEGAQ